jgi:hypothetical protein
MSCTAASNHCWFVHDKYWSAKWLKETIDAEADTIKLLTYVPTFDQLVQSCPIQVGLTLLSSFPM